MSERQYRLGFVDPLLGDVDVFETLSAADDETAYVEARARMIDSPRRWFLFDDRFRLVSEKDDFASRHPDADLVYRCPSAGSSEFRVRFFAQTPAGLRWTAIAQDPDDFGPVDRVSVLPSAMPRLLDYLANSGLTVEEDR